MLCLLSLKKGDVTRTKKKGCGTHEKKKEGETLSLVKDIADYLADNAFGTVGTDIFLSDLPSSPDSCIAVYQNEDTAVERIAGIDVPADRIAGIKKPRFKVVVRETTYDAAMAAIKAIEEELVQIGDEYIGTLSEGVEINGAFYFRVNTTEDAYEQERDANDRVIVAQNFSTAIKI